ncbi:MAG: DUF3386 family protein [Thermomicrobiales bacterium]
MGAAVTSSSEAHAMLKDAHGRSYRFPEGFHGFTADVAVTQAKGDAVVRASGMVTVAGPRAVQVELDGDEALAAWAKQELASMAGHRWPTSYEESDGRYELTFGDDADHPLGPELTFQNDPFSSAYRVVDGAISQVTRSMGPMRFTITMQRHEPAADGRSLPSEFTVSYWNTKEGRLVRADGYRDRYTEVGGVSVPESRTVVTAEDGGFTTHRLVVSNVRLLTEPVEIAAASGAADPHRHGTRAG